MEAASSSNPGPAIGENDNGPPVNSKIDPITALQDGIDGLSLAMFEALRGLRDAVAPESGNLGSNNGPAKSENENENNNTADGQSNNNGLAAGTSSSSSDDQQEQTTQPHPDLEDLWQLYRQGDEGAVALIQSAVTEYNLPQMPQTRDQVAQIHQRMEQSRDTELVQRLAQTVLEKSRWIDDQVDCHIPGMSRTYSQQQERIRQLLEENSVILKELQTTYATALERRNACRTFVQENTCKALDIWAMDDDDDKEDNDKNKEAEGKEEAMED